MSKVKELIEFLEYEAHSLSAIEFCSMLDKKSIPWCWDDCDNILDYNEGRCVIEIIELGKLYWFEDGEFVEEFEVSY
jgi:hypothetical protein